MTELIFFPLFWLVCFCMLFIGKRVAGKISQYKMKEFPLYEGYQNFLQKMFRAKESHNVIDAFECVEILLYLLYATFSFMLIVHLTSRSSIHDPFAFSLISSIIIAVISFAVLLIFYLFYRALPRVFSSIYLFFSFLLLWLFFPIVIIYFWIKQLEQAPPSSSFIEKTPEAHLPSPTAAKEEISFDRKFLHSFAKFKKTSAREIMVARSQMICIKDTTSIVEAWKLFIDEGFSRIPIYRESVDHIIGVLLYKDVMEFCFTYFEKHPSIIKTTPVKTLMSSILFAPEGKRISDLFGEVRRQKIHAAIIVNEYGCTEGIVTMEDILEELVGGEILDEHDEEGEIFFEQVSDREWILDAKMLIVDTERALAIPFPHNVEYETIGGYISWKMGMIPEKGTTLEEDTCIIEVLESTKRKIEKIKITKKDLETS